MRILLTGITSIHGWPIYNKLVSDFSPERVFGVRPPQALFPKGKNIVSGCVTDASLFAEINRAFAPTHVLHAAGVCDLDMCEDEPEKAYAINATGREKHRGRVRHVVLYHVSQRGPRVFGTKPAFRRLSRGPCSRPGKRGGKNIFGRRERNGQSLTGAIVRIGLPMGDSVQGEKGAVDFIEGRFKRNLPMTLFHDEWRSCIHCDELAQIVVELLLREEQGMFHVGGPKPVSLHEIGQWIINRGGYDPALLKKLSRLEEKNGPPRLATCIWILRRLKRFWGERLGRGVNC